MKIKKILILIVIPFLISLSSCWDLGSYVDEKSYTQAFSVHIIDENGKELKEGTEPKYTMEDFYNENSTDFKLPVDENGEVDFVLGEYKYLAFQPTNSIKIGDLIFFVESETDADLTCSISVVDHLPTSLKNLDNDLVKLKNFYKEVEGDAENPPKLPEDVSLIFDTNNEPKEEDTLAMDTVKIKANEFTSVMFEKYKGHGDTLEVNAGEYLLIEFYNNTDTGVEFTKGTSIKEAESMIESRRKNRCSIAFTMFIIEGK